MTQRRLILLIDDNLQFIDDFKFFTRKEYDVISTTSGQEALTHLRMQDPDVVLLDLRLGEQESGIEVLRKIKRIDRDMPVIIITDFPEVETAVEAMRLGAVHYAAKSPDMAALKAVIDQQIQNLPYRRLYREEQDKKFGLLIGESQAMQQVRKKIVQCAKVDLPVLILGESGTGKELVANAIHRESARGAHAICTINCSTLSPNLFESEFFGHEKGAFTGAYARKRGKIELAQNGTLFLDEVADLPIESQPKILEALEYKRFQRVGGEKTLEADVRIIAATNRDLEKAVAEGRFREDLYYRLKVLTIYLPPLRERPEDIPELVHHYLELSCREIRKPVPKVPKLVMDYWQHYSWPGNVRELKNKMMQVAFETESGVVSSSFAGKSIANNHINELYKTLLERPYQEAKHALLERFQIDYIKAALARNNNNITQTAEEIGVHRSTVYRVLKGGYGGITKKSSYNSHKP